VRLLGERAGARPIAHFEVSLIGNPEEISLVGGRPYTMRALYYCLRDAYCCRFLQAMERQVAAHYLAYVNRCGQAVYIQQRISCKKQVAPGLGRAEPCAI
jgi:hypothetical protein